MDQTADLTMAKALGRGIHRQHETALGARVPFVGENHELARHELAAVIVAHRPGDEQQLTLLDLTLEERLTGPGALKGAPAPATAAFIPEHRPEYP